LYRTLVFMLSNHPQSSALVVVYLNLLSCPVVVFLQHTSSRNSRAANAMKLFSNITSTTWRTLLVILQTCVFLTCVLTVFGTANTFGKAHECNTYFVITFFRPFPVLPTSRRVVLGAFGIITIAYTGYYALIVVKAIWPKIVQVAGSHGTTATPPAGRESFDSKFTLTVVALLILSAIHISNTELLKFYNERRTSTVNNSWSFGQVSYFLIFLRLI